MESVREKALLQKMNTLNSRINECVMHYNYAASGRGTFTEQSRRIYMAREVKEYQHLLIQRTIIENAIVQAK